MSRARAPKSAPAAKTAPTKILPAEPVLEGIDASLLDLVDHVLNKGVVVTGDVMLGVADVDLVYLRLSAVLCAADRLLPAREGRKKSRSDATKPAARSRRPMIAKKIGWRR